jgi:methyl-accepting chemotaxis protein
VVTRSDTVVDEDFSFVNTMAFSLFTVVLFIALVSAWLIGRSILERIYYLQHTMQDIAQTNDLNNEVNVHGGDELADMAAALYKMLINFRSLIVEVHYSVNAYVVQQLMKLPQILAKQPIKLNVITVMLAKIS